MSSPELPSIVGRWVSSFMAYYPGTEAGPTAAIPSFIATLSCFHFKDDGSCEIHKERNTDNGYDVEVVEDRYTLGWRFGVPGGDIYISDLDVMLKYLMSSALRIEFIVAHGADASMKAPSAAGMMRRALITQGPLDPFGDVAHGPANGEIET